MGKISIFKNSKVLMVFVNTLYFCSIFHKAYADKTQNETRLTLSNYEPPYPFTPEDLWKNLLQVANLHGQNLSLEKVERIFNLKLRQLDVSPIGSKDKIFAVKAHKSWYYDLELIPTSNGSTFLFGWGQHIEGKTVPFSGYSGGLCIKYPRVERDMIEDGWMFKSKEQSFSIPNVYHYSYGSDKASFYFEKSTDCLLSMTLRSYF